MTDIDSLIKSVNKEFKEDIASYGVTSKHMSKIPFTSPRANYMLYGGIPRGRIVEFAGEEGGGKTTTALDIAANAQKLFKTEWEQEIEALSAVTKRTKTQENQLTYLNNRGAKRVVYADCENTLDEDWAKLLGVDTASMVLLRPMSQTAEQIFEILLSFIETDQVGLIVIDSLGVMLSAQAYEKSMEEKTYGGIAMALTLFSKKAELLCAKYGCTLIGINQMREDLGSSYGGMTTTGGKGWKHNCSVRIMFQKGGFIDERGADLKRSAESPAGNLVMMNIAKTKVCRPDRRVGFYTLKYQYGVDVIADTMEMALKEGYIQQAGSWFTLIDPETGEVMGDENNENIQLQGKTSVIEFLQENQHIFEELSEAIQSKLL